MAKKKVDWNKYIFWGVVIIILLAVVYAGGVILGMVTCPYPPSHPLYEIVCSVSSPPNSCTSGEEGSKKNVEVNGQTGCGEGLCHGIYVSYCENGHWSEAECNTAGLKPADEWGCWDCSDDSLNPVPVLKIFGNSPDSDDYTTSCRDGCTGSGNPKWKAEGAGSACPTSEDEGICVSIMTGAGEALGMTVPKCDCTDYTDFSSDILRCSGNDVLKCVPADGTHNSAYYKVKEECDAADGKHNLCVSVGTGSDNRGKYYSGDCVGLGSGYLEKEISHCEIKKCGVSYDDDGNEIYFSSTWKCKNAGYPSTYTMCVSP